jgi:organic hydroperoxide reductase OsmC/OhrA
MSMHSSLINWSREPHPLDASTYNRNHIATLNGDQTVKVSATAEFKGDATCADPEQMLISAVSSCHMLFFLAIAEQKGFLVEEYEDKAIGYLEKGSNGRLAVSRIELFPEIIFGGDHRPDATALDQIHTAAHKSCFIGNSVIADVVVHDRSQL